MFERFNGRARRVLVLAQEEARRLNHNYIGTEHILLGLIHEGEDVGANALELLGISLEGVRSQVEEIIGQGEQAPSERIPFTRRAKKVLELSLREALQFGYSYIGTEHILLGLIREGEGVAAQVLVKQGADLNRARVAVFSAADSADSSAETVSTGDRLARLRRAKELAIDFKEFALAAWFRDQEKALFVVAQAAANLPIPAVSLHRLTESEVTVLAAIYSSRTSAEQLLTRAGFPAARLPGWNVGNPLEFWWEVARLVEHGIFERARQAILKVAYNDFPANPVLRAASAEDAAG